MKGKIECRFWQVRGEEEEAYRRDRGALSWEMKSVEKMSVEGVDKLGNAPWYQQIAGRSWLGAKKMKLVNSRSVHEL